jgi:hypothetical protein
MDQLFALGNVSNWNEILEIALCVPKTLSELMT